MTKFFRVAAFATIFLLFQTSVLAQLDMLFAPFDCREHAEYFHEAELFEDIRIDSSLIAIETFHGPEILIDTVNGWKHWACVENYSFGKNRGALTMIADLNALHPYFRDKVRELIEKCKKQGIELAIVETYRTHAKQNEYRGMGRKYTNSVGGRSKHQYGLAVDVVPVVKGEPVWDSPVLWKKIGITGEKLGLRWGGRWKKPYDPAHFEWTGGLTSIHLAAGTFPSVPTDKYPCIDEDLAMLRRYWKEWEEFQSQSLMTKR